MRHSWQSSCFLYLKEHSHWCVLHSTLVRFITLLHWNASTYCVKRTSVNGALNLRDGKRQLLICGQSYKGSTIVNYVSWVVKWGYFQVRNDSRVVIYYCRAFIRLAIGCETYSPNFQPASWASSGRTWPRPWTGSRFWQNTTATHLALSLLRKFEICFRILYIGVTTKFGEFFQSIWQFLDGFIWYLAHFYAIGHILLLQM